VGPLIQKKNQSEKRRQVCHVPEHVEGRIQTCSFLILRKTLDSCRWTGLKQMCSFVLIVVSLFLLSPGFSFLASCVERLWSLGRWRRRMDGRTDGWMDYLLACLLSCLFVFAWAEDYNVLICIASGEE
jgi:hypothetical protein